MRKTALGFLRLGDTFYFNGIQYRAGHTINDTNGYVACTDIASGKVTRLHIDVEVEVEQKHCCTCDYLLNGVCVNGDSEHSADFRYPNDTCEHWKQKGE